MRKQSNIMFLFWAVECVKTGVWKTNMTRCKTGEVQHCWKDETDTSQEQNWMHRDGSKCLNNLWNVYCAPSYESKPESHYCSFCTSTYCAMSGPHTSQVLHIIALFPTFKKQLVISGYYENLVAKVWNFPEKERFYTLFSQQCGTVFKPLLGGAFRDI